jgi:hypothetical protein
MAEAPAQTKLCSLQLKRSTISKIDDLLPHRSGYRYLMKFRPFILFTFYNQCAAIGPEAHPFSI